MQPPMPSATATWHNDTYPAISPSRPELSAGDKTIVIIGSGTGIGRQTAVSFAKAGASRIVLLGRREDKLKETASLVASASAVTEALVRTVDITDFDRLKDVAAEVGKWNVIVIASVYPSAASTIVSTDVDEWWQGFETNVKGLLLSLKAFVPTAVETGGAVLTLTTQAVAFPVTHVPGASGYIASKLAQIKIMEYLAAENPSLFAATVHPGICDTAVLAKSGMKPHEVPLDRNLDDADKSRPSVELPADFLVWLASPEGAFLKGRMVAANWDVDELKTQTESIQSGGAECQPWRSAESGLSCLWREGIDHGLIF
ncbi:hypothetical protein KVR01_007163 [Diaporthe batatas]|uniref:uncharacterized protein n=1 Tax=Diaporthe batatas TaxID=748121 RepID=UPI001D03A4AD|nr:uncharacterized protein KVR01_007163 [Diaporthe batatas]KAG8162685.1 hypothetical protein KVR01_007163 [Diaporthe batatas]